MSALTASLPSEASLWVLRLNPGRENRWYQQGGCRLGLGPASAPAAGRGRVLGALLVEVEVPGGLLLEPEPVVLGRLLEELGRLLEYVLTPGRLRGALWGRLRSLGVLRDRVGVGRRAVFARCR